LLHFWSWCLLLRHSPRQRITTTTVITIIARPSFRSPAGSGDLLADLPNPNDWPIYGVGQSWQILLVLPKVLW